MSKSKIAFVVKLITPYFTAVVSALVTWIISHIHVFGALNHNQATKYIVTAVIFGLSWLITYVSAHTKLIPDIEKWANPIIHDLEPIIHDLAPIAGQLSLGEATHAPVVVVHNHNAPGSVVNTAAPTP